MPAFTKSNTSDAESSSSQNVSSLFKINYLPILITTLQEWESKVSGIYKKCTCNYTSATSNILASFKLHKAYYSTQNHAKLQDNKAL